MFLAAFISILLGIGFAYWAVLGLGDPRGPAVDLVVPRVLAAVACFGAGAGYFAYQLVVAFVHLLARV